MTDPQELIDPELAAKIVFGASLSPDHPVCAEILQTAGALLERIATEVERKQSLESGSKSPAG